MLIDLNKIITSDNPNLIILVIDSSSSMAKWKNSILKELESSKDFFVKMEDENSILILRADFSGSYKEKEIAKPSEFDTSFSTGGKSILYYSICRIRESLLYPNEGYISKMINNSYNPKVTLFLISDGKDEGSEGSGYYLDEASEAITDLNKNNVDTHILLFGNKDPKAVEQLGFKHVHKFTQNTQGIVTMFDTIKECSKKRIIGSNNWFDNI